MAACEQGKTVPCVTCAAQLSERMEAADERRLSRLLARYWRLDLLCLDELGHVQLDARGAALMFQILTEREQQASVATASNLPISEWGQVSATPVWWQPSWTGSPSTPHHRDRHRELPIALDQGQAGDQIQILISAPAGGRHWWRPR
jgi:IstB-like ATP binding protein